MPDNTTEIEIEVPPNALNRSSTNLCFTLSCFLLYLTGNKGTQCAKTMKIDEGLIAGYDQVVFQLD